MFIMLEARRDVAAARKVLEATLKKQATGSARRTIGYPGGSRPGETLSTFGEYWFWAGKTNRDDSSAVRHLHWFGLWSENDGVNITVEINTVPAGRNDRIGGFFARHSDTGTIYLFHSARIGGGRAGVGKETFLAWSDLKLETVLDAEGKHREGVLVGPIEDPSTSKVVLSYVEKVAAFKEAVRNGAIDEPEFQAKLQKFRDYYKEPHGHVTGHRASVIDYVSRHGEVVDALKAWRDEQGLIGGQRIVKNVLIDLGVIEDQALEEVYEVKTSTDRSCVYGGIGQLMVHGHHDCRRVLVLPADGPLFQGLPEALSALGIDLIRYRVGKDKVQLPADLPAE